MESTEYNEGFQAYMNDEIYCPYDIEDGSEFDAHMDWKRGWWDARRQNPEIFDKYIKADLTQ